MDITDTDLRAALIDQKVAGAFPNKRYAFVATVENGLGVAVENEPGYNALTGFAFDSYDEANDYADRLNEHIGLNARSAMNIVVSTMRKVRQ